MIDWSIVLSVIDGILIVSAFPYLISASLSIAFVAFLSLYFVYSKLRKFTVGLYAGIQLETARAGDDYDRR